tara:strand:+ start:126 stop:767 length:642 start_codon:yes stop_codon:yes gene_type:complete
MINNSQYRLYGRTKGRKKKNSDKLYLNIELKELDKSKYNILDIGAGFGESTIKIAKEKKNAIVICCEKYIDGLNNLYNKSKTYNLTNIYIYEGNVYQMIDEYCKEDSISEVWILFPDPWPKKRHHKRRLISESFFNKINKYLKYGATINIASDSKLYVSEILEVIYKVKKDFEWLNQSKSDWDYNPKILPETKYFKKALENGLNPFYAKLKKL